LAAKRRAETMAENRIKLIGAARKAFAASGFAAASMDDLTVLLIKKKLFDMWSPLAIKKLAANLAAKVTILSGNHGHNG
jgi:hypothetical protein